MKSTPIAIAVIVSPGMPKTRAGTHALESAELFDDAASIRPSSCPEPNFSGSLESFLLTEMLNLSQKSARFQNL